MTDFKRIEYLALVQKVSAGRADTVKYIQV